MFSITHTPIRITLKFQWNSTRNSIDWNYFEILKYLILFQISGGFEIFYSHWNIDWPSFFLSFLLFFGFLFSFLFLLFSSFLIRPPISFSFFTFSLIFLYDFLNLSLSIFTFFVFSFSFLTVLVFYSSFSLLLTNLIPPPPFFTSLLPSPSSSSPTFLISFSHSIYSIFLSLLLAILFLLASPSFHTLFVLSFSFLFECHTFPDVLSSSLIYLPFLSISLFLLFYFKSHSQLALSTFLSSSAFLSPSLFRCSFLPLLFY